jgi:hypothetical protein
MRHRSHRCLDLARRGVVEDRRVFFGARDLTPQLTRAGPMRAGFCHEDLFMSDSAMPTGCAGGLAGARRMVVLETHLASGRLVALVY